MDCTTGLACYASQETPIKNASLPASSLYTPWERQMAGEMVRASSQHHLIIKGISTIKGLLWSNKVWAASIAAVSPTVASGPIWLFPLTVGLFAAASFKSISIWMVVGGFE
jgi:hypothetical protein